MAVTPNPQGYAELPAIRSTQNLLLTFNITLFCSMFGADSGILGPEHREPSYNNPQFCPQFLVLPISAAHKPGQVQKERNIGSRLILTSVLEENLGCICTLCSRNKKHNLNSFAVGYKILYR